jgi:hypothetical protein
MTSIDMFGGADPGGAAVVVAVRCPVGFVFADVVTFA